ncbi:MAG TPA: carbohydrate-binding family 9-like protein [Clostridiales bacterium]|nr:carbohydrate-binding family 9-like protein [Clostridiales bacterium]
MKKTYTVKKIELNVTPIEKAWDSIEEINIDCFLWEDNGYKPKTMAKLFYTDTHFHILFKSFEKEIKVKYFNMDEDVYKDSCVEFFINPNPDKDDRYFNFEMNAAGTLLLGLGINRHGRKRFVIDNFREFFNIKTSVTKENLANYNGEFWTAQYSIPFTFLEEHFGKLNFKPGCRLEANLYKCGDETGFPHYGCWNPITIITPDFHRSEFFGNLVLE